jgi:hypothetical protein
MDTLKLPDIERLRQLLDYDPETGVFRWKQFRRGVAKQGSIAGYTTKKGYRKISVDGIDYTEHRLAWKIFYNFDPTDQIDHIDRNRQNNKISNLRLATNQQNCMNTGIKKNNTSGVTGVYFYKKQQKWVARIGFNYKKINLGSFDTIEEATLAYKNAKEKYHLSEISK